jgi:hypothetical protein
MLGAFGATLLFICTLVGATLVGVYEFLFAARSVLVAMQGTAVGEDGIAWPDEPLLDWMGGSLHVAALALLWLVPIGIVARGVGPSLAPGDPLLGFLLLAVPGLWLFFPIGLLSSLSATSRWVFFRPAIAAALLRIFPATMLFYLASAALALGVAALWYFALVTTAAWVLVPAALIWAAAVLIYGRLLGRLAWLIHRLNPERPTQPRADLPIVTRPKKNKTARKRPRKEPAAPGVDPWAVPEEESTPKKRRKVRDPWGREIEEPEGYGLSREQPRPPVEEPPPRRAAAPDDDEDDGPGITLAPQEHEEPPPEPAAPEEPDRATKLAMELRERKPPAPPPPWPLFSGVYTFPWYEQSLKAWVWLSFGGLVLGFLVRTLIQSMLG